MRAPSRAASVNTTHKQLLYTTARCGLMLVESSHLEIASVAQTATNYLSTALLSHT